MAERPPCPQCGGEMPADTPEGLCPQCLLKAAVESRGGSQADSEPAPTTPPGGRFVPPEPAELDAHFPQLEILELLGVGGMGAVYKARQPGLDRLVALKILPPEVGRDPAFAERFAREARALAKLSHPNIVAVHDSGQANGYYYFVMEFVEGANLRQMIQGGQLKPEEALAIVPQICEALQFAHDEGVVHRDIKPENILVDTKGRVKIADFGLAKLLGKAQADFTLTGTQQVMGTPHYMAPEQMEKPLEVDHRADIYSLGVVFYEMLTGELPIGRFAPPSKKVEVDVRLDEVVLRALENEPERRYQQVSEVKTDVETISRGPTPSESPVAGAKSQAEQLEQLVLTYLPDKKIAAIKVYREKTGVGLKEAKDAVERIGLQHGLPITIMPDLGPGSWWGVLAELAILSALLVGFAPLVLGPWLLGRLDLNPIISGTLLVLCVGVIAIEAWRHRGTRRGRVGIWIVGSFLLFLVGFPALDFLADPEPGLNWLYRVTGVTPGRHDVVLFQGLFMALIFGTLAWLICLERKQRKLRAQRPNQQPSEGKTDVESTARGGPSSPPGESAPAKAGDAPMRDAGSPPTPRFSRKAIWGAVWAAFFFVALLPSVFVTRGGSTYGPESPSSSSSSSFQSRPEPVAEPADDGPQWWQWLLMFTLLPLGATAPFGTTILGAVSLSEIRHSRGRLIGLPLALADLLLFPLLLLDALICFACYYPVASNRFIDEFVPIAIIVGVLICVVVDSLIVFWAWRRVARNPEADDDRQSPAAKDALEEGPAEKARRQVKWSARGLLTAGIFNWIAAIMLMVGIWIEPSEIFHLYPLDLQVTAVIGEVGILAAGLLIGGFMVVAALSMGRLQSYRLVVAGIVLGMIVPPGCLIGLPAGIWALAVLSRQEVKDVFKGARPLDWRLKGTLNVLIWTILVCLVAIAFHFGLWPCDHYAPASYSATDAAQLRPQSGAYEHIVAIASGKGRTYGERRKRRYFIRAAPELLPRPRQQLTLTLYSKPDLGQIEIDRETFGYRYWDREGSEVAADSGLSEDVLLQWISSTGVDAGDREWAPVATTLLHFVQREAEGEPQLSRNARVRFVPRSKSYVIVPWDLTKEQLTLVLRRDPPQPFASGKVEIALETLGYRYRDREGREVSSDSGLSEEVLLEWLKSAGVDTDSPAVRPEAANLLEVAKGARGQKLLELASPVAFTASSPPSPYGRGRDPEVTVDPWVVPAVCAFWAILWLGGSGFWVVRLRRKSKPTL